MIGVRNSNFGKIGLSEWCTMDIWLHVNISAHHFIPQSCWEAAFEDVQTALPAADLLVYTEDDNVLGFIGITDGSYIAGLFISEDVQSRGIGHKLLERCKQRYPHLALDVFAENVGAVRFYQRNGFNIGDTHISPDFNREEHKMSWTR